MNTNSIPTETLPNGVVIATDLAPFARFVNGTVTAAYRETPIETEYVSRKFDGWNVAYTTPPKANRPNGTRQHKRVPADKIGG